MKKIILTSVIILATMTAATTYAQPVTYLSQNFDVPCATVGGFPSGWLRHNPPAYNDPRGQWQCDTGSGRPNYAGTHTPGMMCTGVWGSAYNIDTSF